MKTSNKLLLAAVIMILGYCVISAFAMKKEYLKGEYKSRFYRMKQINVGNFNAIKAELPNTNITVEYGPKCAIWVHKDLDEITINNSNNTLVLDKNPMTKASYGYGTNIVIICPELKSFTLGNKLPPERKRAIQTEPMNNKVNGSYNDIKGFIQADMTVEVNNATFLTLSNNKIGNLKADVNWGSLDILRVNFIDTASIDVKSYCEFTIDDAKIKTPTYKFANTAKISVTGEALHLLK